MGEGVIGERAPISIGFGRVGAQSCAVGLSATSPHSSFLLACGLSASIAHAGSRSRILIPFIGTKNVMLYYIWYLFVYVWSCEVL